MLKVKVAACVLRPSPDGARQLLLHAFASDLSQPWRLLGGNVDPGETPKEAVLRELAEETGLTQLRIARKLGVQRYYKPFISADVERHDFLLLAPDGGPEAWAYDVQGEGADEGDRFLLRWFTAETLSAEGIEIHPEHRDCVTPDYLPELYARLSR